MFATKGMSTAEIASLRSTAKAQTDAIYRKAGVNGRPRRLSRFIEDPLRDEAGLRPAATADAA